MTVFLLVLTSAKPKFFIKSEEFASVSPKNYQNFRIKTEPVTVGTDATDVWLLCQRTSRDRLGFYEETHILVGTL